MSDADLGDLLAALSREGFGLPCMPRLRDYMPEDRIYGTDSPEFAALKAADLEANRRNREALRRALSTTDRTDS